MKDFLFHGLGCRPGWKIFCSMDLVVVLWKFFCSMDLVVVLMKCLFHRLDCRLMEMFASIDLDVRLMKCLIP
jgi:hypothetical protein